MSLKQDIKNDLKCFIKEKKELEITVLRQALAALLNKEKEKQFINQGKITELTEEETIETLAFEAKKRREAALAFEKGKRPELADKEKKELKILEKYLPRQLAEQEIIALTEEIIGHLGSRQIKDTGQVMARLMPQIKGKADGALVSEIVKKLLSRPRG